MVLKAYAKVNWHLAVGKRRNDGYHPIASVFQTCSIFDVIDVRVGEGPFSVNVSGLEAVCPKGSSTLEKAALIWRQETGFDRSLIIEIQKRIPSQAGLGGGSSDAAALLRFLNGLRERPLDTERMIEIALRVGCDVPFFVVGCRAALVSGLGEIVRPIRARTDLSGFILVTQGEKTSTKEAYDALDRRTCIPELDNLDELEKNYNLPVSKWSFRNDFDLVNKKPDVKLEEGQKLLLTGSGSCHVLVSDKDVTNSDVSDFANCPDKVKAIRVTF